jgi:tetratricopeptide (TPR) repeat protein
MRNSTDHSTTTLNGHFVHSLLLIDVLLRMESKQIDKQDLIALCKHACKGNRHQLTIVDAFEKKYSSDKALWWYTQESFLYNILNKALRTQDIDVMYLFHFMIRDIHQQLKKNQCQLPVQVYRGQLMSKEEIDNLRHSVNNFISINSFFSTSMNRCKAIEFLHRTRISNNLQQVLFEIDADPRLMSSKPFADISKSSAYTDEKEILFMIGCVFRLLDVRRGDNDDIWIVQMRLCGDDEHDMKTLFESMKRDYGGGDNEVDILAFGRVLRRMGKYDLAEKFYRRLLHRLSANHPSFGDLCYSLGVVIMDTGDYLSSLRWLYTSLEFIMQKHPSDYSNIGCRYCCIGSLYWKIGNYNEALIWNRKGIELYEKANKKDHLSVGHFYNNTALVYNDQQRYTEALENFNKALVIYEKHLPRDHPDMGTVHDNIGIIYRSLDRYDLAMKHHTQSLQIRGKSLPSHHPLIALTYKNIGLVYEDKDELAESMIYLRKALTIYNQSFLPQHPDVQKTEQDIKRVFFKLP